MNQSMLVPYRLFEEPRVQNMVSKLGTCGKADFVDIYIRIKMCKGVYPLDAVMGMAGGKKGHLNRLKRLLTKFELFVIDNGMVSLMEGLRPRDFVRRESNQKRTEKVKELEERTYEGTLMPEDLKQMDCEAKEKLKSQIREENEKELLAFE